MQQASTHDFEIPQQQTLGMHMTVPNLPMAILDASRGSFPSPSSCLQVGISFVPLFTGKTQCMSIMALQKYKGSSQLF